MHYILNWVMTNHSRNITANSRIVNEYLISFSIILFIYLLTRRDLGL